MNDSGKPCGINAAHDRVVAENAKLKQELAELRAVVDYAAKCMDRPQHWTRTRDDLLAAAKAAREAK